ncbi:hypothetical protein BJ165DRAFT_97082 [Panaeolus papilionaceus]|nr:hypothetical protein BJ165DRAFT_97082 [Panaeolus papilionaceus]
MVVRRATTSSCMPSSSSYSTLSGGKEGEPLTHIREIMIPRPLRSPRTIFNAFQNDPLYGYLQAGRPRSRMADVSYNCLRLCAWSRRKVLWVIDGGAAIISLGQTNAEATKDDYILNWVYDAIHKLDTEEQQKRLDEVIEKTRIAIDRSRTPCRRFEDMLLVEILAVEPNNQGQGYGTTLLDCVLRYADHLGKKTWLHCSNINNVTFYNKHGFQTIVDVVLGDDNPSWPGPPVIRSIMIREPRLGQCSSTQLCRNHRRNG